MKSECSLICFFLIDIWKKLRFVCYPWKLGGNAEQTCGVLHILFLEYHWAVQVGGIFLLSYQVCTEQSGCSQKLCKEDFDHCIFWKRVKAPWVMDCSQPSFTCQKLRQGWSLKVILPCFFLCCFESIVKWSLLSLKGSYFERFIRQPGSSSLCSEWLELCKLAKNFVSIIIPRDNALKILVSPGNCVEHSVDIQKIILVVVSTLRCLFLLPL